MIQRSFYSRRKILQAAGAAALGSLVLERELLAQSPPVGLIETVNGAVVLAEGGRRERLDGGKDVARLLYPGNTLVFPPGGGARIRLEEGSLSLKGPARWTTPSLPVTDEGAAVLAIRRLIEAPQPAPESQGILRFPSSGGVIRPGKLPIRWQPGLRAVTLILRGDKGDELWKRDNIEEPTGSIDDPAATAVLNTYRAALRQFPLTLEAWVDGTLQGESRFSVLTELADNSLSTELKSWDNEPASSPIRYVGRAAVFGQRRLWNYEAEELDTALQLFPQSRTLLRAALHAHIRAGNPQRTTALRKLLQPLAATRNTDSNP